MSISQEKLDAIEEDKSVDPNSFSKKEEDKLFTIEKHHTHRIRIVIMYVVWFLIAVVGIIRVYHLVTPHYCRWLDSIDISSLDNFLFSGVIGAMLGRYAKQILLVSPDIK